MPGAPFGEEHELLPLGQLVLDEYPVLATILQMQWGRLPLEGKPLGRIRASRSRLAALAARRQGASGAHPVQAEGGAPWCRCCCS